MGTSLVLDPAGAGPATFLVPVERFTALAERYWSRYNVAPPEYAVQHPEAPGVDGTARVRFGFRQRRIELTVWYIGATAQAVNDSYNTDVEKLSNDSVKVTIPDDRIYDNCTLEFANPDRVPKQDENGVFRMACEMIFIQRDNG